MTKSDAIDGLISSGIEEFSLHGFEGASLRDIAARAGVRLSTIHRYFGSKVELYAAVNQQVWDEINLDRSERLGIAMKQRPPELEAIMRAMIEPVVIRAMGDQKRRHIVDVLRSSTIDRRHIGVNAPAARNHQAISKRWMAAIRETMPAITDDQLVWGFSFAVGSLYSSQLFDQLYDHMLPNKRQLSADDVTKMLVAFSVAGLRSLQSLHHDE